MKWLLAITLLFSAAAAFAQPDTAAQRALYETANREAKTLTATKAKVEEDGKLVELQSWSKADAWQKIVATTAEDHRVEEYYLDKGTLLFVYQIYPAGEGQKTKIEERYYFKNNEIFHWLTTEKPAPVFHGEDYQGMADLLLARVKSYSAQLNPAKPAVAAQLSEGVFIGIEEGDYAHWNMRKADGTEFSLFVLQTNAGIDPVLENPKKYIGKKCQVRWKESEVEIPEAGGKQKISQLLGVEWQE